MPQRRRLTPPVANARRAIRNLLASPELAQTKSVLIAVSGGADSMALASACAFVLPKLGIRFSALIVDHGLQEGSNEVAKRTKATLLSLGIETAVAKVKVKVKGQGVEAAARDARYEALEAERARTMADGILLGHNLDDQAETVLLGLTRGSGLRSISGMRSVDGYLLRPFLGLAKADLRQACLDAGIDFWDDPHNLDPSFTRVRIRKLMQQIDLELGPGVSSALARTAELAFEAEEVVAAAASELLERALTDEGLRIAEIQTALPGLRRKALLLWLQRSGALSPSRAQILNVEALITNWHGQKPLKLSGITVVRVAQVLKTSNSR